MFTTINVDKLKSNFRNGNDLHKILTYKIRKQNPWPIRESEADFRGGKKEKTRPSNDYPNKITNQAIEQNIHSDNMEKSKEEILMDIIYIN